MIITTVAWVVLAFCGGDSPEKQLQSAVIFETLENAKIYTVENKLPETCAYGIYRAELSKFKVVKAKDQEEEKQEEEE